MASRDTERFDTIVTLSSSHAGLRPQFQALEDEIRSALARLDTSRDVRLYVDFLCHTSRDWTRRHIERTSKK